MVSFRARIVSRALLACACLLSASVFAAPARADAPGVEGAGPAHKPAVKKVRRTKPVAKTDPAPKKDPVAVAAPTAPPVAAADTAPPSVAPPAPVAPVPAPVAPIAKDAPALVLPAPRSHGMKPLDLDLRLTASSDILLAFVGVGASADVGVAKLGPGTLALGGAAEYDLCGSVCWLLSTVTPLEFSQRQVSLWGRASYHLDIPGKGIDRLDIYPLLMVGPAFASASIRAQDGTELRGKDTAIAVGAGAGINFFVTKSFFFGGEARYRYARGTYDYELVSGDNKKVAEGSVASWSLTGVDLVASMGLRF